MRGVLTSLAFGLLCAAATPALATNGAYRALAAPTATICARACADDGLCIAWILTEDACSLSAIAPSIWPENATEMGLSNRAPHFVTLPARPQILTTRPVQVAEVADQSEAPRDVADYALLGGPDDGEIRPRRASLY